jgi:hypothetical protein
VIVGTFVADGHGGQGMITHEQLAEGARGGADPRVAAGVRRR